VSDGFVGSAVVRALSGGSVAVVSISSPAARCRPSTFPSTAPATTRYVRSSTPAGEHLSTPISIQNLVAARCGGDIHVACTATTGEATFTDTNDAAVANNAWAVNP
jgi:hypothetical protein